MNDKVLEIVSKVTSLPIDEINNNLDTENMWNSILTVEIVFALEEEFDLMFSQDDIALFTTVTKIVETLSSKLDS